MATWQATRPGSWTNAGNWNFGQVPAAGTSALWAGTSGPLPITLDNAVTLGQLVLANSANPATGYQLLPGAGGTLTMDNLGSTAVISVTSGSHGIAAPLSVALALSIVPAAGTTLNISGNIGNGTAPRRPFR